MKRLLSGLCILMGLWAVSIAFADNVKVAASTQSATANKDPAVEKALKEYHEYVKANSCDSHNK